MSLLLKRYKWIVLPAAACGLLLVTLTITLAVKSREANAALLTPGLCTPANYGINEPIPSCGPSSDELALPGQYTFAAWLSGVGATCCFAIAVIAYGLSLRPIVVRSRSLT